MKDYIESYDKTYFTFEGMSIPNDARNLDFHNMQKEIAAGDAQIIVWVQDLVSYKKAAKEAINKKTDELILKGVNHNGVDFSGSIEKQASGLALNVLRVAGGDMTGEKFRGKNETTGDSETYSFADTADFDAFFGAALTKIKTILNDGFQLKDDIDAATDIAGVDAVVDART
jgi:hypothetical protein